ncbi:26S proteasome non-ATPase regulatory subunit 6-like [Sycon ciliatum]|uniref:26S proteasome non-ATPase regulatory subunit 6-like n=1 Tax=Sycon ciliatum TaxID=27933 RepID=UPI0020AD8C08|eukprot:scpid85593/ scgid26766/ 26S proteasome non-ATPase regulatory subunit 6; 26S proteasome regulatory subunit RPN7; 26S proteasome regulatory subunit S10; p42A
MPVENLEEEGLPKNPNLALAQLKFLLTIPKESAQSLNIEDVRKQLMDEIREKDMTPYYEDVCSELKWDVDSQLLATMRENNEKKVKELDDAIEDAEQNLGEIDVRDAVLAKAEYLASIGEKERAITGFRLAYERCVTLGSRLDIVFYMIRIGMFFNDNDIMVRNIEKAKSLIEEGGDWDRRNRLKVYEGMYAMSTRAFSRASDLFLEAVATFTSYELMSYQQFVRYTVLCSMITVERTTLKEKCVNGAEVQEVLHSDTLIRSYLNALYKCQYGDFFRLLAEVECMILQDRWLHLHANFFVREMRILAYNQLLQSYHALTLNHMANAFGVSVEFIDRELARFIAAGKLHCKIDKVSGIVETTRPDKRNYQYQSVIKHGDMLLQRVQKLSRIIDI